MVLSGKLRQSEFLLSPLNVVAGLKFRNLTRIIRCSFEGVKPHLHYTKKWVRTHKKVGTDQIFLPCKPSVPCFYEMGPDSLFSGFGAIGGYGPKTEKKRVRTPFPDRKRCVNASSFRTIRTLFFMWACRALRWFRACALFLYFLHDGVDGVKNAENENDRVDWWRSWPTIRRFCRRDHSNRARESKMPERQKCSVPGSSEEVRTAR